MRQGFSLVELSIVLVILGLLVGGILTGQSLIRAAELRSQTSQMSTLHTALLTFRDKYFYFPGDMPNATDFWGAAHSTPSTCYTTASTGTETCNGDGDGYVVNAIGQYWSEQYRSFQQLANAGLIEGQYSGVTTDAATPERTLVPGTNVPAGKVSNSVLFIQSNSTPISGNSNWFDGGQGLAIHLRAPYTGGTGDPVLLPEEAWNIDQKLDDGMPATGRVQANKNGSAMGACSTTDVTATAEYNLPLESSACVLNFFVH